MCVKFYPEYSLLCLEWKEGTKRMKLEEFEKNVAKVLEFLKMYRVKRFFNNMSNFNFVVDVSKNNMPNNIF